MFNLFINTNLQYFSLLFLITNFVSFYFTKNKIFPTIFFIFFLLTSLFNGVLSLLSCGIILLFGFLIYNFYQQKFLPKYQILIFFGIFIITILSFLHKLPDIDNIEAIKDIQLSKNSNSFDLWLNFDKPLIAIFLLFFVYKTPKKIIDYKNIFWQSILFFVPLFLIVLALGIVSNFLTFDPKIPDFQITFLWLIKMLFLTIYPEEFFFRFFIQNNVISLLKNSKYCQKYFSKNYQIIGVSIVAILFGLSHFSGGFSFVLLAMICGFCYGLVYIRTGYIEASIFLHFLVNLTHFFWFSYPSNLSIS